jgi:hypothetical protein
MSQPEDAQDSPHLPRSGPEESDDALRSGGRFTLRLQNIVVDLTCDEHDWSRKERGPQ